MVHEQVVGVVAPYAEDWSTSCSFFRLRFNFLLRSMELCALGTEGNISTIGHSVWFLSLVWITPVHNSSTPIAFWTNRATKNPSMLSREGSVRRRWWAANIDTKWLEFLEVTEPHTHYLIHTASVVTQCTETETVNCTYHRQRQVVPDEASLGMVMLVESLGHLLEAVQSEPHLHFPSDEWSKCCTQLFQPLELQTIHNNTTLEFFFPH